MIPDIPSDLLIYPDIREEEENEGDIVVDDRVDDLDKKGINNDVTEENTDSDEVDDIHNIHSE